MLRYSLGLEAEARAIEDAVEKVLNKNIRTGDIADKNSTIVGTREMGQAIADEI